MGAVGEAYRRKTSRKGDSPASVFARRKADYIGVPWEEAVSDKASSADASCPIACGDSRRGSDRVRGLQQGALCGAMRAALICSWQVLGRIPAHLSNVAGDAGGAPASADEGAYDGSSGNCAEKPNRYLRGTLSAHLKAPWRSLFVSRSDVAGDGRSADP